MRVRGATLAVITWLLCAAPAWCLPIPSVGTAPGFIGRSATPQPFWAPDPPRHPFMAANGRSEIHDDAYQTDTYPQSGPLGRDMKVLSTDVNGDCGSVTFDAQARVISVCVGLAGPTLRMFDPANLATLATFELPGRQISPKVLNPFQDFSGGGYFYLDKQDRAVIPTTTRHIYVVAETPGPGFRLAHDYDVSRLIGSDDSITSALPTWDGHIVFESFNGVVGTIDPASGAMRSLDLHEETENSFAVDETGAIYIVSTRALYRLDLASDGTPVVTWSETYPNSGIHEPGQVDAGSGTTPTVQGPYVTITDNGNPLGIAVYRRAKTISGRRLVCIQPIFPKDGGADENSLIGAGSTMIAENNFGYTGPAAVELGQSTAPGIVRVDIDPAGGGCRVVWRNDNVHVPTVVSKLSLASGLIYSYTKEPGSPFDPWYFTALDVHTGRLVYRQLAGFGFGYNNNYAPVTIGPSGSAYVGVIGGLVELRDAVAPQVPLAAPPEPAAHVPSLRLRVRHLRGAVLLVQTTGVGVRAVSYRLDGRTVARRARAPFSARISLARLRAGSRHRLSAVVSLTTGSPVRVTRTVHAPAR